MTDNAFAAYIEAGRFEELEAFWLDKMEKGESSVPDLIQAVRLLAREGEKERASFLLALFADHLLEQERWHDRLTVLKEIAKHTHEASAFREVKHQIADALRKIYSNRSSLNQILNHHHYDSIETYGVLKTTLERAQWWLDHDLGQAFYQTGYGVGRVKEINLNLGLIRLDLEQNKDVSVQFGDQDLIPLPPSHILRQKLDAPEALREEALQSPGETLGRLLRDLGRPMTVAQIKEALSHIITTEVWSRWWTAAKKHPQLITSGKGAQAVYSWSESTGGAEESLKQEFDEANLRAKMQIAKQHAGRSDELNQYFASNLLRAANEAYEKQDWPIALEFSELFSKWQGIEAPYNLEQIVRGSDPLQLVRSLENQALRTKVLQTMPEEYYPDAFLQEENAKLQYFLFEKLSAEQASAVVDRVFQQPLKFPAAFAWMSQNASVPLIDQKMDAKFLIAVLSVIDEPEFATHRTKLKKTIEEGLLLHLLAKPIDRDHAQKAVDALEHSKNIEEYRRERWMARIRMSFPEMNKREDLIFSTKEAFERKRAELEQLIKEELPKNRRAIGEAAAMGDLRENFEYKAARQRQDFLINRAQQLQEELNKVRVLDPSTVDCSEVRPGTKVLLQQSSEKQMWITILGPWDSNPTENIYSHQAPLALSILGKTRGDAINWNEQNWLIEKIEPWM